jgi:hypothetical protein
MQFLQNLRIAWASMCDIDYHIIVKIGGQCPAAKKEVRVPLSRASLKAPTGLSFDIPDLLMLQGWADFHELRTVIELDACAEADEYEELVAVYNKHRTFRRWMIWRSCEGIVVQPTMGRTMLFDFMADALEILIPPHN